jgi:hypothetical protein
VTATTFNTQNLRGQTLLFRCLETWVKHVITGEWRQILAIKTPRDLWMSSAKQEMITQRRFRQELA